MRRKPFAIGLLAVMVIAGCSRQPETLTDQYDEKEMEEAIQTAQSTFDQFLERFTNPQPADESFSVKVMIEDDNGTEHFWLSDLNLDSDNYSGTIANDPGIVKNVKIGQSYTFSDEDISDWMYISHGKMEGNYTLRVILKSMPKEKADAIKEKFGW